MVYELALNLLKEAFYREAYRESLETFKNYLLGNKYWNTKEYISAKNLDNGFHAMHLFVKKEVRGRANPDFYRFIYW